MRILRWARNGLVGVGALAVSGGVIAVADYFATQPGSGTSFGSVVVSTVHYAQMMLCDLAAPSRCATVSAAGAVKVDNSAVTQPISAASLPLPTTAATGVAQASTTSGQVGTLGQCAVTTSAPTYTTAQTDPLSCDTAGALRVTGATSNGAVKVTLIAAPTGACTPIHYLSAVSTNSTNVKASAGTLCSVTIINNTATAASFRLYDTASAPTCSSATGAVANYGVQANTTSPGMSPNLGQFALDGSKAPPLAS